MKVRTLVVEGPLALRMARLDAAREGAHGLQILDLGGVAARLAGGFLRTATAEDLETAVAAVLRSGAASALDPARSPGMVRALAGSLVKAWEADLPLEGIAASDRRLADFASVDRAVRSALPAGAAAPPDLVRAATARMRFASAVFGTVTLAGLTLVAPVWRPLLSSLRSEVDVVWRDPPPPEMDLETDILPAGAFAARPPPNPVVCADPRDEALRAVRWIRGLLASGVAPRDVAIAAAEPSEWDDHVLALARESGLPIHFGHGVPALSTPCGQACAALADILCHGLSQDRVRRLLVHVAGRPGRLAGLPRDALADVPRPAALSDLGQWRRSLAAAAARGGGREDPSVLLLPFLEALAVGPSAAAEVGASVLLGPAAGLWSKALRRAPSEALPYALAVLRVGDGRHPGDAVFWGPASHLAAAPRSYVRLLGLTAGCWPRAAVGDPLLPAHVLGGLRLEEVSVAERDRRHFAIIAAAASTLVVSRAARSPQGRVLAPSPLLPPSRAVTASGPRQAVRACSEADRLLLRPREAATLEPVARAVRCSLARRHSEVGALDGQVRPDHPALLRALARPQSATSLRLLLRDPLAFVWRHALGWRSSLTDPSALALDGRAFGELVHDLLARTVGASAPARDPAARTTEETGAALDSAMGRIAEEWPSARPTPPALLWHRTLEEARAVAWKALEFAPLRVAGSRTWAEVPFGSQDPDPATGCASPWRQGITVAMPGTSLRLSGVIDRVDLSGDGAAVRVSDYKTGAAPASRDVADLQRVVYAVAAKAALPDVRRVVSLLVDLSGEAAVATTLADVDLAIEELADRLRAAATSLAAGSTLPGPDARESWNPWRIALPAVTESYFRIKGPALARALDRPRHGGSR